MKKLNICNFFVLIAIAKIQILLNIFKINL